MNHMTDKKKIFDTYLSHTEAENKSFKLNCQIKKLSEAKYAPKDAQHNPSF